MLRESPLIGVHEGIRLVSDFDLLASPRVLHGVRFRFLDHPLDLRFAQTGGGGDGDLLLFAARQVLGGDGQDSVGVDVEADLNLRQAARRRRDAGQLESAERAVVAGEWPLPLQDVDLHRALIVGGST